jgi:hypothetical protein
MREIPRVLVFCALALGVAAGCGDQASMEKAKDEVKDIGTPLEENVERSGEAYKDTYDKSRAEGENVVDASGDAYEAVLEEAKDNKKQRPE